MSLRRMKICGVIAVAAVLLLPATALAHEDYDDPWQTHPFKLAAEGLHVMAFALDRLALRPLHWMMNSKPGSTVTGHDQMNSRLPPEDLENIR